MTATETTASRTVEGYLTRIDGIDHYRIDGVDRMEPFLMNVVSSSDLWMFASSRGTLTAGRVDADHVLLPYETDDRIHRAVGATGPLTIIARIVDGRRELWRPFGTDPNPATRRSLAKSTPGDRLVFEEIHDEWGLVFRTTWASSPSYGWVRRVELIDLSGSGARLEVLDGLVDVMPPGVDSLLEQIRSNLVDAYKRAETGRWHTAAIYSLESLITDRAEPGEALSATVIWAYGEVLEDLHLDEGVVEAMADGRPWPATTLLTGRRGAYLRRGSITLDPGGTVTWGLVADVGLDHAEVVERSWLAGQADAGERIERDVAAGSRRLEALLASADADQRTGDPIADAHHLSNVLFNVMRGGLLPHGHGVPIDPLLDHLRRWNRRVHDLHHEAIRQLGREVDVTALRAFAIDRGDPHLTRLILEFLPLAFSRRHGDPSRPWNRFSIRVGGDSGREAVAYEGNWRDIFQNWEALLMSHPAFLPNAVAKFLNASTFDGHNPYRITHEGVDWEVPDPHDPWANIGYWGDHQIVYLHRLVELWGRLEPAGIEAWLDRPVFVYADIPYEIADRAEMTADPRNTISYDTDRAAAILERVGRVGSDGRLVVDPSGDIVRVGLVEKLLVPVLARLTSFVPGGGIWMNTQRPEWNDANNALAGYGLSMVTLYHLYGYLGWTRRLLARLAGDGVGMSGAVAGWLRELTEVLERSGEACHLDDRERRTMMDALGAAGDRHRRAARAGFDTNTETVLRSDIERLVSAAVEHLRCAIATSRRADGLFDSYNLVSFPSPGEAKVDRLGPMLEGQVAVLSSGVLGAQESVALIEALYASAIYRSDQDSFLLYPVRDLPSFLDKNTIPSVSAGLSMTLGQLAEDDGIVIRDRDGRFHFSPEMVNGEALQAALAGTSLTAGERHQVEELYETVFSHHSYTGRSGSMYGYEGIGSIYWHMVGKLLVAVQEAYWRAVDEEHPEAEAVAALASAYRRIRAGLGFCKSPEDYGAIPTDCYSHTPSHAGAQQPGMTGHVKELIITRFGELGLRVVDGEILLAPGLLDRDQLVGAGDATAEFHYCGVPFLVEIGSGDRTAVRRGESWSDPTPGLRLPRDASEEVLGRRGTVDAVRFTLAP